MKPSSEAGTLAADYRAPGREVGAAAAFGANSPSGVSLRGRRAAVLLYSSYPMDVRPRRAAEALAAAGMEVELLCLAESSGEPRCEVIRGVTVHRIPLRPQRKSKRTYLLDYGRFWIAACWFLSWRALRRRYAVVHVHSMPDFLVFAALVPRLRGAAVILDLHDPMPELMRSISGLRFPPWAVRVTCFVEKCGIAFSSVALTPNAAFQRVFLTRSCRPGKMQVVMNTPEAEIFDPHRYPLEWRRPRAPGEFRVMHHGLIRPRHGVDLLVEAVARVQAEIPGVQLDLYGGRTDFLDEVLAAAERLGISRRVHFHGPKSSAEIAQAILDADLGVVPNRRTPFTEINFPTRIFEYLAMGRPVIAPATEGILDYFTPGSLPMIEPGNVDDLVGRILWVYRHPQEARALVADGRAVYERHLWAAERARFLRIVEGSVGRRKPIA